MSRWRYSTQLYSFDTLRVQQCEDMGLLQLMGFYKFGGWFRELLLHYTLDRGRNTVLSSIYQVILYLLDTLDCQRMNTRSALLSKAHLIRARLYDYDCNLSSQWDCVYLLYRIPSLLDKVTETDCERPCTYYAIFHVPSEACVESHLLRENSSQIEYLHNDTFIARLWPFCEKSFLWLQRLFAAGSSLFTFLHNDDNDLAPT